MTVGFSTTNFANKVLAILRGVTFTAPANTYAQLHVGDPGASGTANVSAETSRKQYTRGTESGGSIGITGTGTQWSPWAAGTETISHVSVWDNITPGAGNFLYSYPLDTPRTVNDGDTFTLDTHPVNFGPLAA